MGFPAGSGGGQEQVDARAVVQRLDPAFRLQPLDNVEVTTLVDPDLVIAGQRADEFEKKYGKRPKIVQDMRRVFDDKAGTGILQDKKYRPGEAKIILELLYKPFFSESKRRATETFETLIGYLKGDKIAIRELAYWHLLRLCQGVRTPAYDPAMPAEQREAVANEFLKLVKEGKLPPGGAPVPPPIPTAPRRAPGS